MLVKMEIDLAKGFAPWKEMFIQNEHRLNAHGGKLVFAGTPSNNENKLTVIMDFESMESLKNFGSDEELIWHIQNENPHTMVIGSDYRDKKIIGFDLFKNIHYFDRNHNFSTTNIISYENRTTKDS